MGKSEGAKRGREKWDNADTEELFRAVLKLRNTDEAKRFFRDLLTEYEILDFAERWKVARLLDRGVQYAEIGRQVWMSSKTIARIQRWLKRGKGDYRLILDRIKQT